MTAAVAGFAEDDEPAFAAALERLGALPAEYAGVALEFTRTALGELGGSEPSRLDSAAVMAARDRAVSSTRALGTLISAGSLPPEDLWPARGAGQLFATVARVGATQPWLRLVRNALAEGWDA